MAYRKRNPIPNRLLFSELVKLTADECEYFKYEVEDVLRAFNDVLRRELYNGKAVLIERLFRIEIKRAKSKKQYDFKTKTVVESPALPRLFVTPTIALLDYIREMPDSNIEIPKSLRNIRLAHHKKGDAKYYDPKKRETWRKKKRKMQEHLPVPN
jgi:nucleoid DNA-binding protein